MFSVVIIAKNEAARIEACLRPLMGLSDDVVVIDAYSEDDTPALARAMGARVIQVPWEGYAQNKNLGNEAARHDWILSIDADETVSDELAETLRALKPQPGIVYELDRLTNYCGQWIRHSGWYPDWKPRLFDRRQARWQGDYVHETLALPPGTRRVRLKGKLFHYSYTSWEDHRRRIERYAALSAKDMHARGKRASFLKIWLSPAFRFLRTLLLNLAFLDGKKGWTISMSGAMLVHRKYKLLREME